MSNKYHQRSRPGFARVAPFLATFVAVGAFAAEEHHPHWSYSGSTGPANWGALEHDYEKCKVGKTQSPIDIRDDVVHKSALPAIEFSYKPSPLKIIDNGHTIQVNYAAGSFITVSGHRYDLVQFHFHHPSEERINGKSFEMVAHLVHRDAEGKLAVVAVLLAKGGASPFVDTLWEHLPTQQEKESVIDTVQINVAALLPKERAYYTFTGSLTTPPCTEGVTWFVLKTPTPVSEAEIGRFAKLYPMDARPVQPLNGRAIEASQ